jgi:hypothetical protein
VRPSRLRSSVQDEISGALSLAASRFRRHCGDLEVTVGKKA